MVLKDRIEKAQKKLPELYIADAEGVHCVKQNSSGHGSICLQLSHQVFWVEGRLVDFENGDQWSILLNFYNGLGQLREATVSYASLYSDINTVFADLANQGLCFTTGKAQRDQVVSLLMTQSDEAPISVVHHYGFHKDSGCFALPDNIIEPKWHEGPTPRLNADLSKHSDVIRSEGNLKSWQQRMASANTPMNIFLLSAGLSNVFFGVLDVEPFGLHIFGASSSGKTNAVRAVAGLWGDSSAHGKTYINKWGSTDNGLELLCAARSGLPLTLDEIRQFKGNFEAVAYQILDGVGKTRMKGNLQQAEQWKWKIILISTGELSTADITTKSGGDIFTGAQIRLLDLPIEGFLKRSDVIMTSEQADQFRTSLGHDFGLAGPEFVRQLQDEFGSFNELAEEMQTWFEETKQELSDLFPENQAIQRVLPRFALILMSGLLAVQTDVLPFTEEEVTSSVHIAIEAWLEAFEAPSDVERAVQDLRSELITNSNRIIDLDDAEDNNLKPIAYRDDKYVYLSDEHIKAITSHVSVKQIAKQLQTIGVLHTNECDRLKVKKDIPGLSVMRVYAVGQSFFGDIGDDDQEPEFNARPDDITSDEVEALLDPSSEELEDLI